VFTKGYIYLAVYIDNLLIVGPDKGKIQKIKDALSKRFQMTDLGPYTYYLGISVRRDRLTRSLWLYQKGYIKKVLREFSMWECKLVITPIDTNKLEPSKEGFTATELDRNWYARAIRLLIYAMLGTRPDIAYAVLVYSCYMANPGEPYIKAVKRIF
jgi:Reverse transcriptase (RNA-dependent DNA polymerase)